ncbi:MAG: 4a-hydroxytetrahydrobiopterin dehydratase [Candidatus Thorarchaeota archaeon]|jgi:4a-hydroxytetrahydrobiopterin dehydratase
MMAESRKELSLLQCVPCRGGIPPLAERKVNEMLYLVPGWQLIHEDADKIRRSYKFKNFRESMDFVIKVAAIAEDQDHHPDIFIHWNEVTLTLYTHAINGMFDNDFIVAAKIDELSS